MESKLPKYGTKFRVKDNPPNPGAQPILMNFMRRYEGKVLTHVEYPYSETWKTLHLCSKGDDGRPFIWWRLEWVDILDDDFGLEEIFCEI